ncbi:penicillin-binding transpeptidase domain-containing protein [Candidatus Poriferisodalis sp.]|uniref:penicillin-binding transpeptidase domain-containing protein n=1 Tax=Candidatus Poriferisodalis sp. TaxID=3101277 RepID=UPI003B028DBA
MNRRIAKLTVVLVAGFVVLLVQLTNLGYFSAEDLRAHPRNTRSAIASIGIARGAITTADGETIAPALEGNNDSGSPQLRDYPHGHLYAHIVGYLSPTLGVAGLERTYNSHLSGSAADISITRLADLFADSGRVGDLELTVHHGTQLTARAALGDRDGAVVVLDPATGAVIAMWSRPSFEPNELTGASDTGASDTGASDTGETGTDPRRQPPLSLAYQRYYELIAEAPEADELIRRAGRSHGVTGVDLPAEADGSGSRSDTALTPLQLALAAAAVANEGALTRPFVVQRITARPASQPAAGEPSAGSAIEVTEPTAVAQLFDSGEAAELLRQMAAAAEQASLRLAPTETTQTSAAVAEGVVVTVDATTAAVTQIGEWAVLLAPAENPVVAVAVVVETDVRLDADERQPGGTLASLIAATAAEAALARRAIPTSVVDGP